MSVVFFLGGACVASLIWAAVMMAYIGKERNSWGQIYEILAEFFKNVDAWNRENEGHVSRLGEICQELNDHNAKFHMEVIELVEKWGGFCGRN